MQTFDRELLRAAELLELRAEELRRRCTFKGEWLELGGRDQRREHDEALALARRFRALAASIH